jgi:hypothetical protein
MENAIGVTGRPVLRLRGFNDLIQVRSIPMTDQAISPLRRRMIEDMTVRTFAPKTQQLCVKGQGLRRVSRPAPRVAKLEDVRRYRLHLASAIL